MRQVAAEEAANGIRANAVAIGWVGGFADSFAQARATHCGDERTTRGRRRARSWNG